MDIERRENHYRVDTYYETIELKCGVKLEKKIIKTYEGNKLISDETTTYYVNNKSKKGSGLLVLFSKDIKEIHRDINIFSGTIDTDINNRIYKYITNAPFDMLVSLGDEWEEVFDLLDIDYNCHELRDLNGIELSKKMDFDYMENITEGIFDLEGLFKHLQIQDSITVLSKVIPIPYYNAEEGRNYTIKFKVCPTDEEWKEILELTPDKDISYRALSNKVMSYYGMFEYLLGEAND